MPPHPLEAISPEWAVLAADGLITLAATLGSLALSRVGRMARTPGPENEDTPEGLPPVSIVVTACNQDRELEENLPLLLGQDYPAPYEVVVVDMASQDSTPQVLERLEARFPTLRHTFTPPTARDISLERLALTLGIRSADHNHTLLLHAGCRPRSRQWLCRMARAMTSRPGVEVVLGPVCATDKQGRAPYEHLWRQLLWLPFAARHGAYSTGQANVAYRKDLFLRHRGFAEHALLASGAIDMMANRHSTAANTTACVHPDAVMDVPAPGRDSDWRLLSCETRRHLSRHHRFRLRYLHAALALPAALLAMLSATGFLLCTRHWGHAAGALIVFALHWAAYHWAVCSSLRFLRLPAVAPLDHFQALAIPVQDLATRLRHRLTDSRTFRKKFV